MFVGDGARVHADRAAGAEGDSMHNELETVHHHRCAVHARRARRMIATRHARFIWRWASS